MRSKEICQKIKNIEIKYKPTILVNNINFWPILRITIINLLYNHQLVKKNNQEMNKNFFLIRFEKLKSFLKFFLFLKLKVKLKKKKNLIISREVYLTKIKNEPFFTDRIFDHILKRKKISDISEKVYISNKFSLNNLNIRSSTLSPFFTKFMKKKFELNLDKKQIIMIKKISKYLGINKNKLIKNFYLNFEVFNQWYNMGQKLFYKNKELKKLFIACWYRPDAIGLIFAAQENNIKTFDIQHGAQGKYQPMYTDWMMLNSGPSRLMPNFFCCWNKITKKNILRTSGKRKDNLPIIIGNNFLESHFKERLNNRKILKYNKKTIIYSMQNNIELKNILIPKFIDQYLLSKEFKKNDQFIFRPHPNQNLQIIENLKKYIIKINKENQITISDSESSFFHLLKNCTHHITAFSSTAIEASIMNINSAVFGQEANEIYEFYLKKRYIKIISNFSEFLKWINSKNKKLKKKVLYDKENYSCFL